MIGFGIDETQAEYVAEIKLRNINREYILKRTEETSELEREIEDLEDILQSRRRVKSIIVGELKNVLKKYDAPRKTAVVYEQEDADADENEDMTPDYPVNIFVSREGYFKKITPQSLRMSSEQKYKDGDGLARTFEATNRSELLVFTDRQQCYKTRVSDFADTKASVLGAFLPSVLGMDEGENVVFVMDPGDYSGSVMFFYENGKAARVELSGYATKTNRKRLTGAYCDKSRLVKIIELKEDTELAIFSTDGRALIFKTSLLAPKSSKTTQGVAVMSLKRQHTLSDARPLAETSIKNLARYRVRALPAAGAVIKEEDSEEQQLSLLDE